MSIVYETSVPNARIFSTDFVTSARRAIASETYLCAAETGEVLYEPSQDFVLLYPDDRFIRATRVPVTDF